MRSRRQKRSLRARVRVSCVHLPTARVVVVILVVLVCACMGFVRTLMPMLARDGRAVRLFARSLIRPTAARHVRVRAALTVAPPIRIPDYNFADGRYRSRYCAAPRSASLPQGPYRTTSALPRVAYLLQPELEEAAAALYPRATKPADVPAPTPAPARDDFDDFDRELAAELGEELPAAPPAAEASDAELDEEMEEVEIETTAAPPQSCAAGGAGAPSCAANAARAPKDTAAAKEETKTAASREGGAVIELSAQNLEATIKDESKHTLVMFYAPWCSVRT